VIVLVVNVMSILTVSAFLDFVHYFIFWKEHIIQKLDFFVLILKCVEAHTQFPAYCVL